MSLIKTLITSVSQYLPTHHQRPQQYTSLISSDDLTDEYLLIEIPERLSPDAEATLSTTLTETHRNGFTTKLTDREGYPSLFPPGASLFETDNSASRLQDIITRLGRFTPVCQKRNLDVLVLNTARIVENIRIAEGDPRKSGLIPQQNIDALAACLSALSDDQYQFVDSGAVPASTRDSHLITFKETLLYR